MKKMRIEWCGIILMVLCAVLSGAVTAGAEGRFVDNGDGTVTDNSTGLMWARTDNMGHINWHDAKLYCENIILSRYGNWRMPTIEELQTLYDESLEGYETICGHRVRSTPQVELSCGMVWSSEILEDSGRYPVSARAWNYAKGYQYSARMSQYRGYRALPVREID